MEQCPHCNARASSLQQAFALNTPSVSLRAPPPLKEWLRKEATSALFQKVQSNCQHLPSQPSVCRATCPLCFQFGKHAHTHLDTNAPVSVNKVRLPGRSIQMWERIHSLYSPGTHQWQESITPESKQMCGGTAMNCKCEAADLPATQTSRHGTAPLGTCSLTMPSIN